MRSLIRLSIVSAAILSSPIDTQAQPAGPGFSGGAAMSRIFLLANPNVQKDLKITETQLKQLTELREKQREQMRKQFGNVREKLKTLNADERTAFFKKLREDGEKALKSVQQKVDKILNSSQRKRLAQLALQSRGLRALVDDDVAMEVGLSMTQRKKIDETLSSVRKEVRSLFSDLRSGKINREEMRELMSRIREKIDAKALDVLSKGQKTKWKKLVGKKADFDLRVFGNSGKPGQPPKKEPPKRPDL